MILGVIYIAGSAITLIFAIGLIVWVVTGTDFVESMQFAFTAIVAMTVCGGGILFALAMFGYGVKLISG